MSPVALEVIDALRSRVPVEQYSPLVDRLCEGGDTLEVPVIVELLSCVDDAYPQVEVLGSLLGELERQQGWVQAFVCYSSGFSKVSPQTYKMYLARILNGTQSALELECLLAAAPLERRTAILETIRSIALNPRERPGGSARAFLARQGG